MASEYVGPSITDLPGWRVGLLFLLFAAIAFLWHRGLQALDLYLKRKGKRGLRKVLRALKEEVLILGVISLVLIAFERYLLRICLPCSGDSCYWQAEGSEAEPQEEAVVVETCGPGSEPMWAPAAIIQAHALLFTIAAVHILYTTVVMLLCLWKMGRWRRFEEHSKAKWLDPIKYSALPTPGGNPMVHFLRCLVKMFTQSVDANAYHALRRLFVERMDVDPGFDFLGFLVESMEEELASIISISFILWAVAIVWIMLPPESWVMVWMGGLAAVALLVVGVKLESIICQLTVHAYRRYGRQDSKSPALEGTIVKALRQSLTKISPFRRSSSPWDCASAQACTNDLEMGFENTPAALVPQEHAQRSTVQRQEAGEQLPGQNRLGFGVGTSAYESAAGASVAPLETLQPTAPDVKQQRPPRQQYMLHGDQPPPVISGMEMEAAQANGQDFIIGIVTDGAECSTNGKDSSQQLEVPDRNPGGSGQPTGAFRRCLNELLAPCSMSAFECWRWPQRLQKRGGGGLAAADGGAAGQGSTPSAMDGGLDSASLFWFGRPRVMLYVIQVIYFENSLALAAFLFSLWQGVDFDWGRGRKSQWYIIVPLLILDLALLVFSALFVLPVYAISTAAGSHCPESVIKHALKNPRLAPCASLPEEAGLRLLRQWQQAAPMRGEQQAAAAIVHAPDLAARGISIDYEDLEWQILHLYNNSLTGIVPADWVLPDSVTTLGLDANKLSGSIPAVWNVSSDLQDLKLSFNLLTGTISPNLSLPTKLKTLSLAVNQLTGTLSKDWKLPHTLRNLFLSNNQLSGTLDPAWELPEALENFDISQNNFMGLLPAWNLPNLKLENFTHCNFSEMGGESEGSLGWRYSAEKDDVVCEPNQAHLEAGVVRPRGVQAQPMGDNMDSALNPQQDPILAAALAAKDQDGSSEASSQHEENRKKLDKSGLRNWVVEFDTLELKQQIGEGSYGRVFLAKWQRTPVAVKILVNTALDVYNNKAVKRALTLSNPVLENLQKEAVLMCKLRHPNIVTFLGVCPYPPCVVTEYCERGSLADVLEKAKQSPSLAARLGWVRRLNLVVTAAMLDTAKGMLHLHSHNPPIIHRDLKSHNLLVDSHWRCKVSDFNLSRILEDRVGLSGGGKLSQQGATNPRWLAPEVLEAQSASLKSDVYSFGIVLWELLTWDVPFAEYSHFQLIKHVAARGRPALPRRQDLPGSDAGELRGLDGYISLMQRCWAHAPEERPSFQEAADALGDILSQAKASGAS
ncbi:hypothetical protein N2152v2_000601 [Parachlorella kessleri]